MARNVHWRVLFKTRSEKLGVLNLYEENYYGEVVELTPAAVPFETQEDSSDKWLEPIRKQTGYIRVIDEGNTEGIMPVGLKDRYVEYLEDGVLKWCGYMVQDVYSSDWDVTPLEVEFPVIGGLGVLEGLYLNENTGLDVVPLAKLLYDALAETGIDYYRIYVPREVMKTATSGNYLYPLMVEVSRFNFFSENDSLNEDDSDWTRYNGETHYNVLAEIMKYWGWTIRERSNDLWITSTVNDGSVYITMSDLYTLSRGGSVSGSRLDCATYDIEEFELAGSDHKRDILQGRKKVVVKASVNPVGVVVPSIDKDKMRYKGSSVIEYSAEDQSTGFEKIKLYVPRSVCGDVQLKSYAIQTPEEVYTSWRPIEQTLSGVIWYLGAYFIEDERVPADEYEKKKNWNLTETVRINLKDVFENYPSVTEAASLPILIMKSRQIANYVSGAFVISATTWSLTRGAYTAQEGNGKGEIAIQFKVGDKYWDGNAWVNQIVRFGVKIGNEEDPDTTEGKGKIISTKTLDQPYTGADGYIMPINESLSGEVELIIHAVRNDGGYYALMLENFKVEYYGVDEEETKRDNEVNRYARNTSLKSNNEEEISLSMATDNDNRAGYGILSYKGANVSDLYFLGGGLARPEINLMKKGVNLYDRSTEKLTLQFERKEINPQDLITANGKQYAIASVSENWADETSQYIIMEL